ncbi:indole-3-glycerol-phosphate synthase [Brevundimonas faecalis]|uniref:indole-3-glycerol-phosphate synthase n=1 Tax=Brevundimonas faecalis TaxID=947378 RepID=UPI00361CB278
MRLHAVALILGGAALLAACDFEGGDPVQHALRDAAAARQAAALKTTEEEQSQASDRGAAAAATPEGDKLSQLVATRRRAVEETRALMSAASDPALKSQLSNDLKAEEERLRALEARIATR